MKDNFYRRVMFVFFAALMIAILFSCLFGFARFLLHISAPPQSSIIHSDVGPELSKAQRMVYEDMKRRGEIK